jgi:Spy/CpxP family protein refolding chaperone
MTRLLIGITAAGLVAGTAYANRGHMMKHMIAAHIEDMEDYIEATPQQRQVIESAKDEIVNAFQSRMKARQEVHGQLMAALTGDKVDEKALYDFADARAQDVKEMAKIIVPQIVKVHDALTPAQRQKLAERAKARHERWQGGFGGQ